MTDPARPERGEAALGAEATSAASQRGPAKGQRTLSVSDPQVAVKTASVSLAVFRGCVLTKGVAGYVAALIWTDFPMLTYEQIEALIYPKVVRGRLLDETLILDRARAIATVVCL